MLDVDMPLLLIGLGGFAGAVARYLVDGAVAERTGGGFPWGTLVVNLSGSFVLGLLFALTAERAILPADIRGPVMIGFIGAYTTFSTWMLESWRLIESGSYLPAIANLGGSVVLGLLAMVAGLASGGRSDAHRRTRPFSSGSTSAKPTIATASRSTRPSSRSCATAGSPVRPSFAVSKASGRLPACTRPGCSGSPRTCRSSSRSSMRRTASAPSFRTWMRWSAMA